MENFEFYVKKSNGLTEPFKPEKLMASLIRAGATEKDAQDITQEIISFSYNGISTLKIYSLAHKLLRQHNHNSHIKYSLKKAMLKLGPAGYTFEQFFSDVLKEYGYETKTNVIIKGQCIKHEVDVLAIKNNTAITIECKYHTTAGRASDAKVALYIHSRFKDLEEPVKKLYRVSNYEGWLVTNTRFTIDAISYARCMNFKILGWRYPAENGLEKMIEDKRLYPVTIISGIKANLSDKLISNGIMLVKDIVDMDEKKLETLLGLSRRKVQKLKQYAINLCNHTID